MSSLQRPQHAPGLRQQQHGNGPPQAPAPRRTCVRCSVVLTAPRVVQPVLAQTPSADNTWSHVTAPSCGSGEPTSATQAPMLTPKKLEQLGRAFQLDARTMQALVHSHPAILAVEPHDVHRQLDAMQSAFATTREQAVGMVQLAPWLLLTPPTKIQQLVQGLAAGLGLPMKSVLELCRAAPDVLRWEPEATRNRWQKIATVLDVPLEWVAQLGMQHTQLLSMQPSKVLKRLQRLVEVMGLEEYTVKQVVAKHPRLLSTSTRIVSNKMKVVQSVLNTSWPVVARLVVREPELVLSARQDNMRAVYEGLQRHLPCSPPYALEMIQICPRLLLTPSHVLGHRIFRLLQLITYSERWSADWDALTPFHAATLLDKGAARHSRLQFLLDGRLGNKHGLPYVLHMDQAAFYKRYPGYRMWLQQHAARGQGTWGV